MSNSSNAQWLYLMAQKNGHAHQCVINISDITQKVVLTKLPMHPQGLVRDVKKESPRDFLSQLPYLGKNNQLDLVHSNLDEMSVLSISRYKYTTIYLDDHSSIGVMFYPKNKNEEFAAFKTYKPWAKRQLCTTLKWRWFDWGGEFLPNGQKEYMKENRIDYQMSMPDTPQQNRQVERF